MICNKHQVEVVMKSVGLINKFNSICKWKDNAIIILKDIDKLLSWINSFLSWSNLNKAQFILSQDEFLQLKITEKDIQRQTWLIMAFDNFSISDSQFKFTLFTNELEAFKQILESATVKIDINNKIYNFWIYFKEYIFNNFRIKNIIKLIEFCFCKKSFLAYNKISQLVSRWNVDHFFLIEH